MKTPEPHANPSVVLAAFLPETTYTLTVEGWIVLESLGNPILRGDTPGLRDIILAVLVMAEIDTVRAAKQSGTLDALVSSFAKDRTPGDILALAPKIGEAISAALLPADSGVDSDGLKKSTP